MDIVVNEIALLLRKESKMSYNECIALLDGLKSWDRIRKLYELVNTNRITFNTFQKIMNHYWWID